MNDRALLNATCVSPCLYYDGWTLLMAVVAVGIQARLQPSTGSRRMYIILLMESHRLWCRYHF